MIRRGPSVTVRTPLVRRPVPSLQSGDMGNVFMLIQALHEVKELYEKLQAGMQAVEDAKAAFSTVKAGPPGPIGVGIKGEKGDKGDSVKLADVVAAVVPLVPRLDEDVLIEKVLKKVRKPKDGRAGKDAEPFDMSVIEKMLEGRKFRLEHVEGLEQTLSVFKNFMARGGVRGGGDTVGAGTGISIVNIGGVRVISATSSGANVATEQLTPTQAGSSVTLNLTGLTHTFIAILGVYKNGQLLIPSDATFGWSRIGNTITVLNAFDTDSFQVQYTY